jgi:plastocyanin
VGDIVAAIRGSGDAPRRRTPNQVEIARVDQGMIAVLSAALLLAATTHDIGIGDGNTYSPSSLRVAAGDTVRWAANGMHPLVFEGESGGPYTTNQQRTLVTPGKVAFYCDEHGAPGGVGMSGTVTVNAPPTIAIERQTTMPRAGEPVAFLASASDPEGKAMRIDWDLDGDGTFERAAAGATVSATYAAGPHTVGARATDDLGASATATHTFTVPAGGGGGGTPGGGGTAGDDRAPRVEARAPDSIRARKLRRRGVRITVTPSEDGRVVVELRNRRGRRLARKTADAQAGEAATLRLRPERVKPGRLRVRIVATDRAGNRTVLRRKLTVAPAR